MDSVYEGMTDAEKKTACYLKELNLWWIYEFPVFVYDNKKRPRVWTPDFYIPKVGMYVEVCGKQRQDYEFREKIYKEFTKKTVTMLFFCIFIRNKMCGKSI